MGLLMFFGSYLFPPSRGWRLHRLMPHETSMMIARRKDSDGGGTIWREPVRVLQQVRRASASTACRDSAAAI